MFGAGWVLITHYKLFASAGAARLYIKVNAAHYYFILKLNSFLCLMVSAIRNFFSFHSSSNRVSSVTFSTFLPQELD